MEKRQGVKVSVLIPCYNDEKYIGEAIESVLNQTYDDYEIIVADNGSTDNSLEVIKSYEGQIKWLHMETNGWEVWENMLNIAKGEYLACLFSDDYWYPEKLRRQMEAVEEHPECDIFFTWVERTEEDLDKVIDNKIMAYTNRKPLEWLQLLVHKGTVFDGSSLLIKNNGKLQNYQSIQKKFWQLTDYFMYINMVRNEYVYIVEEYLIKHRQHGSNISAPTRDAKIRTINEDVFIKDWLWENLSDEEFLTVFENDLLDNLDVTNKTDVMCQRILTYLELGKIKLYYRANAMEYLWSHYDDIGVGKMLEEKYQFSKEDMRQYAASYGVALWQSNNLSNDEIQILSMLKTMFEKLIVAGENGYNEEIVQVAQQMLGNIIKLVFCHNKLPSASMLIEKCLFIRDDQGAIDWEGFIALLKEVCAEIADLL